MQRVVRAFTNEIRWCYMAALDRDPVLRGSISVAFVIAADGSVRDVGIVERTLTDSAMLTCVTDSVRAWTFPPSNDGEETRVVYPYVLTPE